LVFLAIWAIRPRLCSVHIQSLNHKSLHRKTPTPRFSKRTLNGEALSPDYFFYLLQSPLWQGQLEAIMAQTTRNQVSIQKQAFFRVALPPIAEQHRIVAKIDALMALCDRLEASLTTTAATRRRLLDALLAEALAPADTRELEAAE
jgi:type I restriction enzyme S subunit